MKTLRNYVLFLFVFLCPFIWAQDESFESPSVPGHWSGSGLSTSTDHYKSGSQSLQWDWSAGDVIDVSDVQSHGLIPAQVWAYYDNTFELWIYNEAALPDDSLIIEFMNGGMVPKYTYHVHLDFTGWRAAQISYRYDMTSFEWAFTNIENMRIIAPASGSGTLFFDRIDYTTERNTSKEADLQLPYVDNEPYSSSHSHWEDMVYTMEFPVTEPLVTPGVSELEDIALISERYNDYILGNAPSADAISTANINYASLGISVSGTGEVDGKPLFGSNHPSSEGIFQIERILYVFARDYQHTGSLSSYDKFMNSVRHMLDQGFDHGSLMETVHHIGYQYRNIPRAIFLMRDELVIEGLWDRAYAAVEWYVNFYVVWDPEAGNSDMDEANTRVLEKLGVALYRTTDAEQLQALKGVRNYVENWVLPEANISLGVKTDYSGFHHSASYPGYSYHAFKNMARTIRFLSETSLEVSDVTREHFKKCLLGARISFGGTDIPYGLWGRKGFGNTPIKWGLFHLGLTEPVDLQLIEAFNKMYGTADETEAYGEEELPQGFWQFNYAPMGVYRQSDWIACLKGFKKGLWGTEIYSSENRFGRYQSYGSIGIYYDGGREASGYREEGWDWNKVPGTTVIELPMSDLEAPESRLDEHTEKTFAGSLRYKEVEDEYLGARIEGEMGMFAMDFQQEDLSPKHNNSFKFRKSVFCYDGFMVCIGSGIENDDLVNPTHTNLFQLGVTGETQDPVLNGTVISSYPYSNTLPEGTDNWLIDNYGTGYYLDDVPAVDINGVSQTMPNHKDTYTATGNFFSAYLDHGTAPIDEYYIYTILPGTTTPEMEAFYAEMADPLTAHYTVHSSDPSGHVLTFNDNNVLGYALFEPNADMTFGRVKENLSPCLIFEEDFLDSLVFSICTPDLHTDFDTGEKETGTVILDFVLDGEWYLSSADGGDVTVITGVGETTMSIEVPGGEAVDVILVPLPEGPVADFSYSESEICVGDAIDFEDESINDPTDWLWEFGDGETALDESPTHTYGSPGVYTVTLTVTNDFGTDVLTLDDLIIVNPTHATEQDIEICEGESFEIGGSTYVITGTYEDLLTNSSGCDSLVTTNLTVNPLPVVSWTADESVVDGAICNHAGLVILTGEPVGGEFTGTGIIDDTFFDPNVAGEGDHIISYSYTDENGCENNFAMNINVIDCAGIAEASGFKLEVYPNPNMGQFLVRDLKPGDKLIITNELGQVVFQQQIDEFTEEFYFSGWASGIYNIGVTRGSTSTYERVIVIKRD